jgi:hypothetical protein
LLFLPYLAARHDELEEALRDRRDVELRARHRLRWRRGGARVSDRAAVAARAVAVAARAVAARALVTGGVWWRVVAESHDKNSCVAFGG